MKKFPSIPPHLLRIGASIIGVLIVIGGGAYFALSSTKPQYVTATVTRGPIVEQASASGAVKAVQSVDLAFTEGGIVAKVLADTGDSVRAGDALIALDTKTLETQLAAAKAAVAIARAQTGSTETSADKVRAEQDTLVENARRTLNSTGLAAVPDASSYGVTAPVISGSYDGLEGTYRLSIDSIQSGIYRLFVFGIENPAPVQLSKTGPTPLGTHGLYISFPDALIEYLTTQWSVVIPNTKSASYAANMNAYQAAQDARNRAIASAEATLAPTGGASVAEAQLQAAEADMRRVQTALDQAVITAPFSGIVTRQDAKIGQIVNAGAPLVSLSSESGLEVELNVSEDNVAKVKAGDTVTMTLDALPGATLTGKVLRIDPASTEVGGAAYFKTDIALDPTDAPLRAGMSVDALIETGRNEDALVVPASALAGGTGTTTARVLVGGKVEIRTVTAGLRNQEGMVEATSGLSAGDIVITGS